MVTVVRKSNRAAYAKLAKLEAELGGTDLKIGWFPTDRYPDEDSTPVAAVAVGNEFGIPSMRIPARPFMRPTVARMEGPWRELIKSGIKSVASGGATVKSVLDHLGLNVAGEIRRSISEVYTPPLAELTIQLRKERMADTGTTGNLTKPLVDTRLMFDSVNHIVEDSE